MTRESKRGGGTGGGRDLTAWAPLTRCHGFHFDRWTFDAVAVSVAVVSGRWVARVTRRDGVVVLVTCD